MEGLFIPLDHPILARHSHTNNYRRMEPIMMQPVQCIICREQHKLFECGNEGCNAMVCEECYTNMMVLAHPKCPYCRSYVLCPVPYENMRDEDDEIILFMDPMLFVDDNMFAPLRELPQD